MSTTIKDTINMTESEAKKMLVDNVEQLKKSISFDTVSVPAHPGSWADNAIRRTVAYIVAQSDAKVIDLQIRHFTGGYLYRGLSFVDGWEGYVRVIYHYTHRILAVCGDFEVTVDTSRRKVVNIEQGCFPFGDVVEAPREQLQVSGGHELHNRLERLLNQ
jgi:hypothetical protein